MVVMLNIKSKKRVPCAGMENTPTPALPRKQGGRKETGTSGIAQGNRPGYPESI
jgi:hypothetical protein